MKSPSHHHSRSKWAHCNTPAALRRRRAAYDAKREAMAALMPPDDSPMPGQPWQSVVVLGASGKVLHRIDLLVPEHGRCDQHGAKVDGKLCSMMTATEIGRRIAGWIFKRPSLAILDERRRINVQTIKNQCKPNRNPFGYWLASAVDGDRSVK